MNNTFEIEDKYYSFIKKSNIKALPFEVFKSIYDIGYNDHINESLEKFSDFNNY